MILSPLSGLRRRVCLAALTAAAGLSTGLHPSPAQGQALFGAQDVEQQRFVLVAAPIGSSGSRYQLNIYEQVNDRRPCFTTESGLPSAVNPLLATFDFTGICSRYIDANGYSLRVGGSDLATSYRLLVRSEPTGTLLVALPTKTGAGPEMIVARSGGPIGGFHKLQLEPGWLLMRRTYGGRRLGHLYVYNASWPGSDTAGTASTAPAATPLTATPPASAGQGAAAAPNRTGKDRQAPSSSPAATTPAADSAPASAGSPGRPATGTPATPSAASRPPGPPPSL